MPVEDWVIYFKCLDSDIYYKMLIVLDVTVGYGKARVTLIYKTFQEYLHYLVFHVLAIWHLGYLASNNGTYM